MSIFAKLSMFLEDDSGAGWSDNFYVQAADLTGARTVLDSVIPDFMAMRPDTVRMTWARASDVAVRGDSLLSTVPFPVVGTYTLPAGAQQMEPGTAMLIQLFASATAKGHWFFRGGPNSILSGRDYVTGTTWDGTFTTILADIEANFLVRRKNATPPPTFNYLPITGVTVQRGTTRKVGRPFGLPRGRR